MILVIEFVYIARSFSDAEAMRRNEEVFPVMCT